MGEKCYVCGTLRIESTVCRWCDRDVCRFHTVTVDGVGVVCLDCQTDILLYHVCSECGRLTVTVTCPDGLCEDCCARICL